jgi:3-oxoacyl-[acyl-carrier-protein] synthase-3
MTSLNYGARIVGTGLGIPSKRVTNDDLAKIVETNDEWIQTRTGIKERQFVDSEKGEVITDVCQVAGEKALKAAGWKAKDLDLVICSTISPETFMPNQSARILGRLGADNAAAFDMSAACGGFVVGLHTANSLMRSGAHKKALLYGAEALSAALNMKDRTTCVLFGDGAACVALERFDNPNPAQDSMVLGTKIYTDFDEQGSLAILGSGSRAPAWRPDLLEKNPPFVTMNGQDVFKAAVKGMVRAATELLTELKVPTSAVKWFVPHQANLRIIEMTAKYLDFPMERVFVNIDRWANTSAATTVIALAEMSEQGLLKKGDLVLVDVFGGGFSYGAALIRW